MPQPNATTSPLFNLSPETRAHLSRLFGDTPAAAGGGAAPPVGGGSGGGFFSPGTAGRGLLKALPGAAMLGDLANAGRRLATGDLNLQQRETQQLGAGGSGLSRYVKNVSQNLLSPGAATLSFLGAGQPRPAGVGGLASGLAAPLTDILTGNYQHAARVKNNPGAVSSIDRALRADNVRTGDKIRAGESKLKELASLIAKTKAEQARLRRDPQQAFTGKLREGVVPALSHAVMPTPLTMTMSRQRSPARFGWPGRLAATFNPLAAWTLPATDAALNANSFNRLTAPRRQQLEQAVARLTGEQSKLQQLQAALQQQTRQTTSRRSALHQTPLQRLGSNIASDLGLQAPSGY